MDAENTHFTLENHLREKRRAQSLSQQRLAALAGITRQAISALEANLYSPATSVALRLARALSCRVEDLFSLQSNDEFVEGEIVGLIPESGLPVRAQVIQIEDRVLVRPLDGFGELTSLSASADGLIIAANSEGSRARVRLLGDRETVLRKIVVGGCDPAMFLVAEHLRKHYRESVAPCLMGSGVALNALKRGVVHVAGIHLAEEKSGSWKLPDLKKNLGELECTVVTFAHWEEGLIVRRGNPKKIRTAGDLAKATVRIINRESGSGARRLLDQRLKASGISAGRVRGYGNEAESHLEAAWRIKAGLADAGVGVRAAAVICGLEFVPWQRERYDLVIPKVLYDSLGGVQRLLDTIVSKPLRDEIEALGGYDTREAGKVVAVVNG